MKVLNINSYYYSSTVHKQLQRSLLEQQLDVFTYVPVSRGYVAREECQYENDEHVKKVECYNEVDRYVFHVKHIKILKNITKKIDVNKYGCLHAHSLFSNGYIAMKIKEKYGIPYIVAVRDTDVNTFFEKMIHLRSLGNKILKQADGIVFLSSSYRDKVINKYVKDKYKNTVLLKSHVIPNGISKFWLENISSLRIIESKVKIRLLHVGAVSKRKNVLATIKAIQILRKKGYDIRFTVVGKIADKEIYEEIIAYDFVKYVSPIPKEKLLKIYRENNIFIMPSITETFGLVYPEAMSQGLPVIYTRGQGFDGRFEEGEVGYNVDCFNYEEIAGRIQDIIINYDNISNNCIKNAHKFDWTKISQEYINLYSQIV
ncbi:MAG: hypothetical protein APF76_16020 [Desulfitibacter sp. BRH_c19]|nr:MAG: hypothetical protein APF76_16020 [Desulfitibacter sp. BRH_c19]